MCKIEFCPRTELSISERSKSSMSLHKPKAIFMLNAEKFNSSVPRSSCVLNVARQWNIFLQTFFSLTFLGVRFLMM
jgi:hypothetical protein